MSTPTTSSAGSLPGPQDVSRTVLPNGIILLTRANFNSPSVVIQGYLPAGCMLDPLEKLGVAHFTSLALMRGTQQHTHQQLYDLLESAGASLGFSASVHTTGFGGRALVEDLPLLLDLLNQSMRQPVFPEEHIERLRAQLLTHLAIRAQDTEDMASLAFDEIVFPNHPYGRPEDGYPGTIQAITRADILEWHQHAFGPSGMVIVIVGAITAEQALQQVQSVFGDWRNPQQVAVPVTPQLTPLSATIRRHIPLPGKSQADLEMGMLGPRRAAPEYMAASLGNSILGQFGMMGRIGDVVREQAGLAYHASTSLNAWRDGGSWEVSAGVNPANLQKAIDLILTELGRFIKEPVTAEELADSKANFIGRLPLSLESNSGVAGSLLSIERFSLGMDYLQRYPAMVQAITREQVLAAAQTYITPDRIAIVSAGPEQL